MKSYLKHVVNTRVVVYSLLAVFAVYALFGPAAIQSRNMERGALIKEDILKYLSDDEVYSQIEVKATTACLGRNLYFVGQVPSQDSLDSLKEQVNEHFHDDVIRFVFAVSVGPENCEVTDQNE